MDLNLEALGITKEELQQRVVDRVCDQLLTTHGYDEDGEPATRLSDFHRSIEGKVKEQVAATIAAIAEKNLLPNVASYIESLCLQETTKWGEKVGKPITFVEYLVQRADSYLREEVDYEGKSKAERNGYSWTARTTRISHLIHEHLHYSIEHSMTQALGLATKSVKESLEAAVKLALEQVKVTVKTEVKS